MYLRSVSPGPGTPIERSRSRGEYHKVAVSRVGQEGSGTENSGKRGRHHRCKNQGETPTRVHKKGREIIGQLGISCNTVAALSRKRREPVINIDLIMRDLKISDKKIGSPRDRTQMTSGRSEE